MSDSGRCPVCDCAQIPRFLHREAVPVHQNLVLDDVGSATGIRRGDLDLSVCHGCGFVFNRSFELSKLEYGATYDNSQSCSPSFADYLERLAQYLMNEKGVRNCRIVEVGCGRGAFLRRLVEQDTGNVGYGFDPSYSGPLVDLDGRLNFSPSFYGPESVDIRADIVICRHVIEHVPAPVDLLNNIYQAVRNSVNPRLFFETPSVRWILENRVIWDFFYEHCSYFSSESLTSAFEMAGFEVEDVSLIFGDQYLWLEATVTGERVRPKTDAGTVPALAARFTASEGRTLERWRDQVAALSAEGGVAIWGAGAKGVTFANLLDPRHESIACVVDLNPGKQGRFIAGTGHPIVDYLQLPDYGVRNAILMNPNYRDENLALLKAANLDISLVQTVFDEQ